ncbi:flavin-containing monooxygenase 5-like [Mya arenaria]|uniref:flavin-containing monooxygenase 5-like n=1 Tax=Mya arenaria TaxID=6604 RepID=UPI0022DF740A|nr:flavin-containing monooxygenase 5-like [Mya arenaria]XP_052817709.1 flavin-containing monooxygenase 5-like [Mya arenaria]
MAKKRVLVIGAGASGLTAIKCCLDEGLEPVCFERSSYMGGLWHYTSEVEEGQACVMKSTVINTSKEMMCYSDFPIPAEFSIYMHNTQVDRYLNMYADEFGMKKYIQFNREVVSVKPSTSGKGKWDVVSKAKGSSNSDTQTYDALLVCTGHHANKNIPDFPGLDKFKGDVVHTHDFKDHHGYEDKRVLVIGIGNSGGDVTTELSRISSKVYLSTRSGAWIFNRVAEDGDPWDMRATTRFDKAKRKTLPWNMLQSFFIKNLNKKFDHAKYCLQPNFPPFSSHPTMNDELPNRIVIGSVVVKANVSRFTENGVEFEDGTKVDNIDKVVMATGYIFGFPFLDKSITEVKENKVNLFKYMFPPDDEHHTLAIIGCFQPLGAIMPLSEMQCRVATKVFKGEISLPDRSAMWEDIRNKQVTMAQRYKTSTRHTIQVDYVDFMDELAELIGCKPNLGKLVLTDPKLAFDVFFGPASPYQYRLHGPGAWKPARKYIQTQWERTYKPLTTRPCKANKAGSFGPMTIMVVLIIAFVAYFLAF